MSDAEEFRAAADQLSEALGELEDVDLNPLLIDEARTVLDAREDLREVCLRLRHDQHAMEDDG